MTKSRFIGDHHLLNVYEDILYKLNYGIWCEDVSTLTRQTSEYILEKFPNPEEVICKLEKQNPDAHHDLVIIKSGKRHPINLFIVNGSSTIQPKNLGAKSFLSKYFLSESMQEDFNKFLNNEYQKFLAELLMLKGIGRHYSTREMKAKVKMLYPGFDESSNIYRDRFLLHIRDYCFSILQYSYNSHQEGFTNAYNILLMAEDTNIITRIKGNSAIIEEFTPQKGLYENIILYKKGKSTIGINYGSVSLTLRFKFENKPDSSIKLATSFEFFQEAQDFHNENIRVNSRTIGEVENLYKNIVYSPSANLSNAVGKCHEAFSYYWLLKLNPSINQVDNSECITYLTNYLPKIDENSADAIRKSSEETAEAIIQFIQQKKGEHCIVEGIQLVADIYTSDRLNTGDIKISIRCGGSVEEIFISLKAVRKLGQKITTKNPGIGTILGKTYFDIKEDFNMKVAEVEAEYKAGLEHKQCLRKLNQEIGMELDTAPQEKLKRGIQHLLGKALMVITAYEQQKTICLEHEEINTRVLVRRNVPSDIQNTLIWNDGNEQLSLRVKFSSGQSHGWSPIKLTAEYMYDSDK